jgi:hypothetical protein
MKTAIHAAIILREKLFEFGGSIILRGRAAWKVRSAIKVGTAQGWLTHEIVETPDGDRVLLLQESEGEKRG